MKYQIEINQKLVEWAYELDRYNYGDLRDLEAYEWLRQVRRIHQNMAQEVKRNIFEQVPPWEPEA